MKFVAKVSVLKFFGKETFNCIQGCTAEKHKFVWKYWNYIFIKYEFEAN